MPFISFEIQRQKHSEWCWAAVASSISHHYSPNSPWCQCKLASEMARRSGLDCCQRPFFKALAKACNKSWVLASALRIVGKRPRTSYRPWSFKVTQEAIRTGTPVCARIEWPDTLGHFLVISGCNRSLGGDEWLYVKDPLYGDSRWLYAEFCINYQYLGGRWTDTFRVKG